LLDRQRHGPDDSRGGTAANPNAQRHRPLTLFSSRRRLTRLPAKGPPNTSDQPPQKDCQRSFNRQSTAFVMRGLWVRLPPLALVRPAKRAFSAPLERPNIQETKNQEPNGS